MVELDLGHLEAAAPLGLVPQTIVKRAARVLLGDEELHPAMKSGYVFARSFVSIAGGGNRSSSVLTRGAPPSEARHEADSKRYGSIRKTSPTDGEALLFET